MSLRAELFKYPACPIERDEEKRLVVLVPRIDERMQSALKALLSEQNLRFRVAAPGNINREIEKRYPQEIRAGETTSETILRNIIEVGRRINASDILIETFPTERVAYDLPDRAPFPGKVRFNIEGVFEEFFVERGGKRLARAFFREPQDYDRVLRLIRSSAGVRPDDDNLPGDGRLEYTVDGSKAEYRVAIVPTSNGGQKVVMRLVLSDTDVKTLDELSFPDAFDGVRRSMLRKGAFVLIAGPTHGGKTTTAYALLRSLPLETMNVYSVEFPIEGVIAGITQINIPIEAERASDAEMTMGKAIRALVRQNPSLAMVGEIRDDETAEASLILGSAGTGLIATIHSPRAKLAIERLKRFKVDREDAEAIITSIFAQDLVRRVCATCAIKGVGSRRSARKGGCAACSYRGYSGMFAVTEHYERTDREDGQQEWTMHTRMEQNAQRAIEEGVTDVAEVARVFGDVVEGAARPAPAPAQEDQAA